MNWPTFDEVVNKKVKTTTKPGTGKSMWPSFDEVIKPAPKVPVYNKAGVDISDRPFNPLNPNNIIGKEDPSEDVNIFKETFKPSSLLGGAKKVADYLYDTAGGIVAPGITHEELRDKQILKDTVLGIPKAIYEVGKQTVTHPVKTTIDFTSGAAKGLSEVITTGIINIFVPKQDREMTKLQVDETLEKYLGGYDNTGNNVRQSIEQGGQAGGSAAPFVAAGGIFGEVGGSVLPKIFPLVTQKAGTFIGTTTGFIGAGQTQVPIEATVKERSEQLMHDLVGLGLFEIGSRFYTGVKTRAETAIKQKLTKQAEVAPTEVKTEVKPEVVKPTIEKKVEPTTKTEVEQLRDHVASMQENQRPGRQKTIAKEYAAIKRQVEGRPTAIELRKAEAVLKGNYEGKSVKIGDKVATITKVYKNKVEVKMANGRKKTVLPGEITARKPTRASVIKYIKDQGAKIIADKKAYYKDFVPQEILKVTERLTSKLVTYPIEKPSRKQINKVKADIKKGKKIEPIRVSKDSDGNLGVIDGVHRLEAYKELGIKKIPTVEEPSTARKQSKVASSIESKALEEGMIKQGFNEVAGYDPVTVKGQAELVSKLLKENLEKAKKMIRGEEPVPENIREAALIKGLEDYAMERGDINLARDLARSPLAAETSRHAQELRLLAERNPDSAVTAMREVKAAREAALEKRTGKTVEKAKAEEIKKIKDEVAKKAPTKQSWESFIESIKC